MAVMIASEALSAIRAAADATPAVEVCGLLLGAANRIEQAIPCDNVAISPMTGFEIAPAALIAAHRAARAGGPAVLGHYHSHPYGSAIPSPRDAAAAAPDDALWLIVGAGEMRVWRAVVAGQVEGRFDAVACETASTVPKGAPISKDMP